MSQDSSEIPQRVVLVTPSGNAPDATEDDNPLSDLVEQPAKVMRIGSMIKQLLDEVKEAPLDEAARSRLRHIHQRSIKELEDGLAPELIEELEPASRGFYTGSIGWTDLGGYSRFNIAIRTAVIDGCGLTYWAGGGIVADSDAEREYEETLLKSETLFRACGALHHT